MMNDNKGDFVIFFSKNEKRLFNFETTKTTKFCVFVVSKLFFIFQKKKYKKNQVPAPAVEAQSERGEKRSREGEGEDDEMQ